MSDVVDRIRDLLRLAEGNPNEHEAAAALALAQRLMAQHRIERAEIEARGADREPLVHSDVASERRRIPAWERALFCVLCETSSCASMVRSYQSKPGEMLRAVGRTSDVQVVRYMHAYIVRQILELGALTATEVRRAAARGELRSPQNWNRWHLEFRIGAAVRIARRLEAVAQAERESARVGASSAALVLVDGDLARANQAAAAVAHGQQTTTLRDDDGGDGLARALGRRAGDRVRLDRDAPGLAAPAERLERGAS